MWSHQPSVEKDSLKVYRSPYLCFEIWIKENMWVVSCSGLNIHEYPIVEGAKSGVEARIRAVHFMKERFSFLTAELDRWLDGAPTTDHVHDWKRVPELDNDAVDRVRCDCGTWGYVTWSMGSGRQVHIHSKIKAKQFEASLQASVRRPPEQGRPPQIDDTSEALRPKD